MRATLNAASRDKIQAQRAGVRRRADATLLYPERHYDAGGYYSLYCDAPDGVTVEVGGPGA